MTDTLTAVATPDPEPEWHVACNFCSRKFTSTEPREFCSLDCRNRRAWYGDQTPPQFQLAPNRARALAAMYRPDDAA